MVRPKRYLLPTGIVVVCFLFAHNSFAHSPRLTRILPGGIQRGEVGVLEFFGERLADAQDILFFEPGFELIKLEAAGDAEDRVKATIRVAQDCRLGEHAAHLRTASGVTEFRTFFVEPLPQVVEQEPNSDVAQPQPIPLNVTVTGIIDKADVDRFVVDARKGQRLTAEVVAMRLSTHLLDTYVAILDNDQKVLGSATRTPFARQDGIVSLTVPRDGKYTILIREIDRGGSDTSNYRLHIGTFPRPTAVFPPGGKLGDTVQLRYLGDVLGEYQATVNLPAQFDRDFRLEGANVSGHPPTPIPFRLFEQGNVYEVEPNDTRTAATKAQLPLAFNGIIESPGDIDHFSFRANKGDVFDVECYARRLRSALDPIMHLYDASGKQLLENDDGGKVTDNLDAESRGPDSYFRFLVPADGDYVLRVTDHLGRGGPAFVYRVEFSTVKPWMLVRIPRIADPNGLNGQYRQQMFVARGNSTGCMIRARRKDFDGPLVLEAPDLPAGVTMESMPIPAGRDAFPVVFHAAKDAPLSGKLVAMTGRHQDASRNISGKFYNQADLLLASPGLTIMRSKVVQRVPVVVIDHVPFRIELPEPQTPLVRDGTLDLKVKVHRDEGFDREVLLQMPFLPRGVGTKANITVAANETEAVFPLLAHPRITPHAWKVCVVGSSSGDKDEDKAWVSSRLVRLDVAKQHVLVKMTSAMGRQGDPLKIFCELNHIRPFEGEGVAELTGLPSGAAAGPVRFTKDTSKFVFHVRTDDTCPVGKHATLTCRVAIPHNGAAIVAKAGRTVMEIERAESQQRSGTSPQNVTEANEEKPLSRLEQLRAAARRRVQSDTIGPPAKSGNQR